jgi:hypothetical protein
MYGRLHGEDPGGPPMPQGGDKYVVLGLVVGGIVGAALGSLFGRLIGYLVAMIAGAFVGGVCGNADWRSYQTAHGQESWQFAGTAERVVCLSPFNSHDLWSTHQRRFASSNNLVESATRREAEFFGDTQSLFSSDDRRWR